MRVTDWPLGLVTCTSRAPAVPGGHPPQLRRAHERDVRRRRAADPPRRARHEVRARDRDRVPPAVGPEVGDTDVSDGAEAGAV